MVATIPLERTYEKVYERPRVLLEVHTHYCPGCTHGVAHRLIAEVLEEMGLREITIGVAFRGLLRLRL
jgi:2-oxoglutarate ferredoxin oxidoreductase subunit beta